MAKKTPSRLLTIFLLKSGIKEAKDIFKKAAFLEKHEVGKGSSKIGDLYVNRSNVVTPRWVSLFSKFLDVKQLGIKTASSSAVLLIKRDRNVFAVTFGQGRHLLKPGCYEEDFGLLTTLNAVNPGKIRTIDRKRFDAISRLTREQAGHEVPIFDFGLEAEQDMLRTLTGIPYDERLGKRLSGRDSLAASVNIQLENINSLLDQYLLKSKTTEYTKSFPWIDSIKEAREKDILVRLEEMLIEKLIGGDFNRLWLVVPDLMDWANVEGFCYSLAQKADIHGDISAETFLEQVRNISSLDIDYLRRHRVYCISTIDSTVIHEWPVYRCIYAEIDDRTGTFILDNGKWYKIDTDMVSSVNREIDNIRKSALDFTTYTQGETEENYNKRFAAQDPIRYALMDRKMITYGHGRSSIEFCDVFTNSKALVHVKRYGGSSVLSHLFAQGVNSASLFLSDETFRANLNKKLPTTHKLDNPSIKPNSKMYEIAFAIASQSEKPLLLPFFSRVTLRNAYRQLSNYGFVVTYSRIFIK